MPTSKNIVNVTGFDPNDPNNNKYINTCVPNHSGLAGITSSSGQLSNSDINTPTLKVDGDSSFGGDVVIAGNISIIDENGNKTNLNPNILTINVRLMAAVKVMDENSGTSLNDAVLHKDFYFYSEKARDYIRLKQTIINDKTKIDEKYLVLEAMFDMPDEIQDLI